MSALALLAGFGADALVGDPRRGHPVAGFGALALRVERALYAPTRRRGAMTCGLLVGAAAAGAEIAARVAGRRLVLAVLLWAALGGRSLGREAHRIAAHLRAGDLDGARRALPALAGRDPSALDEAGVARAVVESVAENTSDAVVGAAFWAAAAGPAGVAAFRAANTLDAMVGHRSERYAEYGWAAARLDDALGWLPARLTVLCAALSSGRPATVLRGARRGGHPSPNAGIVEAAFAAALGLRLGGPLRYGAREELRPWLGDGRAPDAADVARAVRLSRAAGLLAVLVCAGARR